MTGEEFKIPVAWGGVHNFLCPSYDHTLFGTALTITFKVFYTEMIKNRDLQIIIRSLCKVF
jgi:hypothetical protein